MFRLYKQRVFVFISQLNVNIYLSFLNISVYVDMGTTASDTTTLAFEFTDSTLNQLTNMRNYEIKVTQLPCSNEYKYV